MSKQQKQQQKRRLSPFVAPALAVFVVVASVALAWTIQRRGNDAPSRPKVITRNADTPFTRGTHFVLDTYDIYDGNPESIRGNLTPAYYAQLMTAFASPEATHDPVTCSQNVRPTDTGGNAPYRVAVGTDSTLATLQVHVDVLTRHGDGYYYSVGPAVTVDQATLKITHITCP